MLLPGNKEKSIRELESLIEYNRQHLLKKMMIGENEHHLFQPYNKF